MDEARKHLEATNKAISNTLRAAKNSGTRDPEQLKRQLYKGFQGLIDNAQKEHSAAQDVASERFTDVIDFLATNLDAHYAPEEDRGLEFYRIMWEQPNDIDSDDLIAFAGGSNHDKIEHGAVFQPMLDDFHAAKRALNESSERISMLNKAHANSALFAKRLANLPVRDARSAQKPALPASQAQPESRPGGRSAPGAGAR